MITKNERPRTIEGNPDSNDYTAPEVTLLEVTLEKGFATSSVSGTEDWGSLTW